MAMILFEFNTPGSHFFKDELGMKQGLETRWWDAERLHRKAIIQYQNGDPHGPYTIWRESGAIWFIGFYEYSQMHGETKEYHLDGSLRFHTVWNNGEILEEDARSLSCKDKLVMTLKYGTPWL